MPGLVHVAVIQSPVHGGTVATFDKESVAKFPGVLDVVPIPNGVAIVAKQYWQALRIRYRAALRGTRRTSTTSRFHK